MFGAIQLMEYHFSFIPFKGFIQSRVLWTRIFTYFEKYPKNNSLKFYKIISIANA